MDLLKLIKEYNALNLHDVIDHDRFNEEKKPLAVQLVQEISARVMHGTGKTYNTALGNIDGSKGEFRKGNVNAGGSYFRAISKTFTE